jgi:hypothetical protein
MLSILIMVSLALIPLASTVHAQGILDLFDNKSDSNPEVSFLPGEGNMTFTDNDNITVGQEKALNNTIGNATEFKQPGFDPSKPIREYDSNSSDWTKIHPFDEGRAD